MATEVAIKIFAIIFLVLSGNDHSVKVSSNSEVGSGNALWEFFGFLRELVLQLLIISILNLLVISTLAYIFHSFIKC